MTLLSLKKSRWSWLSITITIIIITTITTIITIITIITTTTITITTTTEANLAGDWRAPNFLARAGVPGFECCGIRSRDGRERAKRLVTSG